MIFVSDSDSIPQDVEIVPEFYKRMKRANTNLEKAFLKGEENIDDRLGKGLIASALIVLLVILYGMSILFSKFL